MKRFLFAIAAVSLSAVANAQEDKPAAPTEADYEDVGQLVGMEWNYVDFDGEPYLGFEVPETDHRLWQFACEKYRNGRFVVGNTLLATPREMRADDRFGFSIRVDNKRSHGLIGRMDKTQVEGEDYHFPHFKLVKDHALWEDLRRGNRAFVNLNGNKFSIHLKGSGDAIKSFLDACN